MKNLLFCCGCGIISVTDRGRSISSFVSEIGAINRFDTPNKLVAFAGLDVKVTQSGEFEGTKQHISKRGSPYLQRAIWLTANRAAVL